MKRFNLTIVFVLLFLLVLSGCSSSESTPGTELEKPEKIVQVQLEQVVAMDLQENFTLPASLEAWEDLTIAAEIAGPVRKLKYQEGERVAAGAILLEIDPETVQSSLNREQENYNVIKRKLSRYRELSAEGLVSTQELDDLENSLTAAEAGLLATRLQLQKCFPAAPIKGVVDYLYVDRGEFIDVGKPLLRLVQVDRLKVIADVPEKDVPFLQVGQQVEVIPATINNRTATAITGQIEHIAYTADDMTRTYRTKIAIDNKQGLLRPGMIVRARFVRRQLTGVVSAPLYAVLDRDGEKVVFVEENGFARKLSVETESSVEQRILISSGLQPGQKLIVKGQQLLIDGAKVQVEGAD
ncbi:MAG TPA: efflux RND transporter periplasmic adaptor subunit [Malonomonas sp.]